MNIDTVLMAAVEIPDMETVVEIPDVKVTVVEAAVEILEW